MDLSVTNAPNGLLSPYFEGIVSSFCRSASGQGSPAPIRGNGGSSAACGTSSTCGTVHGTRCGAAQRGRGMAEKGAVDTNKNARTPPTSTSSTSSSSSQAKSKSATPGGFSAQEENLLKELAAKKKAVAAQAAENVKKASRKRAANILSKETEIETGVTPGSSDEEGDDHHAQSPSSKVRRIRRSCSPVADSQNTGMVQSILDADVDSINELDKEDQEYQEEAAEAEEEVEKYMEEVEGEHNKFAGEETTTTRWK
ncbi:hypothetical protein K503DRAFT_804556 [Rhizopogon vinicolor AM-OR11-026]|uniref:Uncharacterized protein n=1 Tax=Rhizopogon vinicolor AM-OR11-026 TaxID=1314800 RepID=A0A1B7MKR9_9AGAM|nr:hypothetical protein K503DRAFT_804556 [Rhizopogon vinicolor AM-OR11-026]